MKNWKIQIIGLLLVLVLVISCAKNKTIVSMESNATQVAEETIVKATPPQDFIAQGQLTAIHPDGKDVFPIDVYGHYPDRLRLDVKAPFLGTVAMLIYNDGQPYLVDYSQRQVYTVLLDNLDNMFGMQASARDVLDLLSNRLPEKDDESCHFSPFPSLATFAGGGSIRCSEFSIFVDYNSFELDKLRNPDFFLPIQGLVLDTLVLDKLELR